MDFQDIINTAFAVTVTGLLGFGTWIVKQINAKPDREEVRTLISDKQEVSAVYIQELKHDIRRLEEKLDKLLDKLSKL